jgi:hypothetical protein
MNLEYLNIRCYFCKCAINILRNCAKLRTFVLYSQQVKSIPFAEPISSSACHTLILACIYQTIRHKNNLYFEIHAEGLGVKTKIKIP